MTLPWYGWIGLALCLSFSLLETGYLAQNSHHQAYEPYHVVFVGLWWALTIAIISTGAK